MPIINNGGSNNNGLISMIIPGSETDITVPTNFDIKKGNVLINTNKNVVTLNGYISDGSSTRTKIVALTDNKFLLCYIYSNDKGVILQLYSSKGASIKKLNQKTALDSSFVYNITVKRISKNKIIIGAAADNICTFIVSISNNNEINVGTIYITGSYGDWYAGPGIGLKSEEEGLIVYNDSGYIKAKYFSINDLKISYGTAQLSVRSPSYQTYQIEVENFSGDTYGVVLNPSTQDNNKCMIIKATNSSVTQSGSFGETYISNNGIALLKVSGGVLILYGYASGSSVNLYFDYREFDNFNSTNSNYLMSIKHVDASDVSACLLSSNKAIMFYSSGSRTYYQIISNITPESIQNRNISYTSPVEISSDHEIQMSCDALTNENVIMAYPNKIFSIMPSKTFYDFATSVEMIINKNNNVIHAEQERGLSNIPPTQNAVTLSSVKINPNK